MSSTSIGTYRQSFDLDNPAPGTKVQIKYLEGLKWYILWVECPDGENIIQGWISTKAKAVALAKDYDWIIVN